MDFRWWCEHLTYTCVMMKLSDALMLCSDSVFALSLSACCIVRLWLGMLFWSLWQLHCQLHGLECCKIIPVYENHDLRNMIFTENFHLDCMVEVVWYFENLHTRERRQIKICRWWPLMHLEWFHRGLTSRNSRFFRICETSRHDNSVFHRIQFRSLYWTLQTFHIYRSKGWWSIKKNWIPIQTNLWRTHSFEGCIHGICIDEIKLSRNLKCF